MSKTKFIIEINPPVASNEMFVITTPTAEVHWSLTPLDPEYNLNFDARLEIYRPTT